MKNHFFVFTVLLFMAVLPSCQKELVVNPGEGTTQQPHLKENGADGVVKGWSRRYNCLRGRGMCAIGVSDGGDETDKTPNVSVYMLEEGSQLLVVFKGTFDNEDEPNITVDENFDVDSEIADILGYDSITILTGDYPITHTESEYGEVLLNVSFTE